MNREDIPFTLDTQTDPVFLGLDDNGWPKFTPSGEIYGELKFKKTGHTYTLLNSDAMALWAYLRKVHEDA